MYGGRETRNQRLQTDFGDTRPLVADVLVNMILNFIFRVWGFGVRSSGFGFMADVRMTLCKRFGFGARSWEYGVSGLTYM